MKTMRVLKTIPVLSVFLFACNMKQFDPTAHRERYEKERLNSNIKRLPLNEDGTLAKTDTPPAKTE